MSQSIICLKIGRADFPSFLKINHGSLASFSKASSDKWHRPSGRVGATDRAKNKKTALSTLKNGCQSNRRALLTSAFTTSAAALSVLSFPNHAAAATRAVGSGEIACREAGDCLQKGEWDGAVGWNWGGKDRCDASDPQCGPDGKLRGEIVGKSVPPEISQITCVAVIRIDVGREESGVLRLGFYGKDAPASVEQLASFLSEGLETLASNGNRLGSTSIPVSLTCGGVIDTIVPGSVVDFGVPSQTFAYGRSRGMSRVDNFVVQPRPKATATAGDKSVRSHDAAGLVSVSLKGLGYGGTGFESDDEAFESSFLITADAVPSLDKTRRVVGQVLDASSMAFLERLASLPTKRGIRGVIPGQTSGPPLLKTVVREVAVSRVTDPSLSS